MVRSGERSTCHELLIHPESDAERIELTLTFPATASWVLTTGREIKPVSDHATLPALVGCFAILESGDQLWQYQLPKVTSISVHQSPQTFTAHVCLRDRRAVGLSYYGQHKIDSAPRDFRLRLRCNRLVSLEDAAWLEPFPNGAPAAVCLTDHPDWDDVQKARSLRAIFATNEFRFTKGVFPCSDPLNDKREPGLDNKDYRDCIASYYGDGCEIAYHGLTPRKNPPPLTECIRRIAAMSSFRPTTWIDHGSGDYLFSRLGRLPEGIPLVDLLEEEGVVNYWSYFDVWQNPVDPLGLSWAASNTRPWVAAAKSMLLHRGLRPSQMLYHLHHAVCSELGTHETARIRKHPFRRASWESALQNSQWQKRLRKSPFLIYAEDASSCFQDLYGRWVFDTTLLNHLAIQLRPRAVDLLCELGGLLVGHTYMGAQHAYGGANCFSSQSENTRPLSRFIEAIEHISSRQRDGLVATVPFAKLRESLTHFAEAELVRVERGWKIEGTAVLATRRAIQAHGSSGRVWPRNGLYYSEVADGQILFQ